MGLIDLKNKLICDNSVSDSNFSFKKSFNALLDRADKAFQTQWAKVPSVATITGSISKAANDAKEEATKTATAFIKNADDTLKGNLKAAEDEYNKATGKLSELSDATGALFSSCDAAQINNPQAPVTNPVADVLASPSSNNSEINNVSKDSKLKKQIEDAKSQNLQKISTVITAANNDLSNKGIAETREIVKTLGKPNPILTGYIEQLKYFSPISENVGETLLGYTIDKPSLQLADWGTNIPKPIRMSSEHKVRKDIKTVINDSYASLNKKFVSNISNEFYQERNSVIFNKAHSYHIAGDSLFAVDHISMEKSTLIGGLAKIFKSIIGEQVVLINYLSPIDPQYKITPEYYVVNNENKKTIVDKRNNVVRQPFEKVNNDSITPSDLAEV